MSVTKQVIEFLQFICVGIVLAIIFDFFRAYRKFKIPSNKDIILQDILYFFISTIIVVLAVINILDSNFRLYIILAILLGALIHINSISKYTIKFFVFFFKMSQSIFEFLNITLTFYKQLIVKICSLLRKIVKKCCKSFFYVINFNRCRDKILHKKVLFKSFKQKNNVKEVSKYETKEI